MRDEISSPTTSPSLRPAEHRALCTDCGVSRLSDPSLCGRACQFLRPDYPGMERAVHGRTRDPALADEAHFGPYTAMLRARLTPATLGAQWTGLTTRIAERLLGMGRVDAVLTVRAAADDRWRPEPVLVTDPAELAQCRGMRMGYAPTLALLEEAAARGYRRLALIGLPCQVYALRRLETQLGLERLYVIGTPCSDNTTTEAFHGFLSLLAEVPEDVTYLEFRTDFHVELRFKDGTTRLIPFLHLPIADLPPDFFPLTCRTCVDYTNVLADITVGYMGGDGDQWLLIRNARGAEMLQLLGEEVVTSPLTASGNRRGAVQGFIANTERAAGGLPLRRMPRWLRGVMAWVMPRFGPKGLEFARARVEMKAAETVLHLRHHAPRRMKTMIPAHVWALLEPYGIEPRKIERREDPRPKAGGLHSPPQ
ncbi:MAG: Coenzyme F420 hydrogenase/dehydrogenase, beta subunit C-terminal domain [Pseudomonadota bacterium]